MKVVENMARSHVHIDKWWLNSNLYLYLGNSTSNMVFQKLSSRSMVDPLKYSNYIKVLF